MTLLGLAYHLRCKFWDVTHGVDTCGEIPLTEYEFASANKTAGLRYQSHHPKIIREALESTNLDFSQYTFVDYGCGKGRALLVASEFGFRRIIGLEFVPQLADIARKNLEGSDRTQIITADATEYELPQENALLYFFSPFSTPVMDKVFERIERSLSESPRDIVVLFSGRPAMREKAFGRPPYERLDRKTYFDLYRRGRA
jgi:SAM-dependent methyltransferase